MVASDILGELPNTFAEVFDKDWDYLKLIGAVHCTIGTCTNINYTVIVHS